MLTNEPVFLAHVISKDLLVLDEFYSYIDDLSLHADNLVVAWHHCLCYGSSVKLRGDIANHKILSKNMSMISLRD